ncbi:MAG: transglycosylase domain-containing protein, partial [Bacteroidales bacterium]|nr:transglycosylase domain-containing protein [Bacteroidales bacterium]
MTTQKKKKAPQRTNLIVKYLWIAFGSCIFVLFLIFLLISEGIIGYMPPVEELENPKSKYASEIYSDDGEVMGRYYQSKANRVYVSYDDISPFLVNALIATEDIRYGNHSGIDAIALLRTIGKTVILRQKSAGGGSTITQQLAKQLYSPPADSFWSRVLQKPIEWVIAVKLEKNYTKEEIINMYLNQFDFLYNAVGIQSAAFVYFGAKPNELRIEEAATLVGMCKNPSLYNPMRELRKEITLQRRNTVLEQMFKYRN